MNRKELRRLRRFKNDTARARNRAWMIRNLGHWCNGGGQPLAVMDDPSEDHVKALLMSWLTPRAILDQTALALKAQYEGMADQVLLKVLQKVLPVEAVPDMTPDLASSMWSFLTRLSYGAQITPPPSTPTIKVW